MVRQKLAYEWKNVYRGLHLQDLNSTGKVTRKLFERILHETKVFLTKEELNFIYRKYTTLSEVNPEDLQVDYQRLSRELGLQSNTLNLVKSSAYHKILSQYGTQS